MTFSKMFRNLTLRSRVEHCVKSVRIRSCYGPYFPALVLNTERYGISLRIQSGWGKMRTRITPNTVTFYAVWIIKTYLKTIHGTVEIEFHTLSEKKPSTKGFIFQIVASYQNDYKYNAIILAVRVSKYPQVQVHSLNVKVCFANHLTGFYMMASLTFHELTLK